MRSLIGFLVLATFTPGILFFAAGTVAWPMGWAYAVVVVTGSGATHILLGRKHPETVRERGRGLRVDGTAPWDLWLAPVVVWSPVLVMIAAGIDVRLGGSTVAGSGVRLVALAMVAACYAFAGRAMLENRYFVAGVRLQEERGQTVVRTGPYRFVRHPGYAASMGVTLLTPVVLDSAWAFVPAGIGAAALVARTALEDRFLRRGLDGYAAYAAEVRHRLVPGIW